MMILGDSWGQLMCGFQTFDDVLKEYGYSNKAECLATTKSGSWAKDWAKPGALNIAKTLLINNAEIKAVFLSAGGNDLLGSWKKSYSAEETEKIFTDVAANLRIIIKELTQVRPDIQIVVAGYDYPNFDLLPPGNVLSAYRKLYEEMEKPSVRELNSMVVKFSYKMNELEKEFDNVYFAPTLGINQHLLGIPAMNIKAGELPAPNLERVIGGNPEYAQPREALLDIQNTNLVDPYHLGKSGFKRYARQIMDSQLNRILQN